MLYAALKPEAAFAEALLRQLKQMLILASALAERALSVINFTPVFDVDLTAHGLRRLSCDNRIADELPYRMPGLWSRALRAVAAATQKVQHELVRAMCVPFSADDGLGWCAGKQRQRRGSAAQPASNSSGKEKGLKSDVA